MPCLKILIFNTREKISRVVLFFIFHNYILPNAGWDIVPQHSIYAFKSEVKVISVS